MFCCDLIFSSDSCLVFYYVYLFYLSPHSSVMSVSKRALWRGLSMGTTYRCSNVLAQSNKCSWLAFPFSRRWYMYLRHFSCALVYRLLGLPVSSTRDRSTFDKAVLPRCSRCGDLWVSSVFAPSVPRFTTFRSCCSCPSFQACCSCPSFQSCCSLPAFQSSWSLSTFRSYLVSSCNGYTASRSTLFRTYVEFSSLSTRE